MTRYEKMFARLAGQQEGAFIPFVMLGDPNIESSEAILIALVEAGADALEVGIPFSDPIADGPTIQRAAMRALKSGATLTKCFELLTRVRKRFDDIPIGILTYANLVVHNNLHGFYESLKSAGADSILVADVPTLEAEPFLHAASDVGIAQVFVAPPNANDHQLKEIARFGRGYTYVVTRSGVTGADSHLHYGSAQTLRKLKEYCAPPPIFGFGISKPEHVQQALSVGAAGAICGSAIVSIVERMSSSPNKNGVFAELQRFVSEMKSATR